MNLLEAVEKIEKVFPAAPPDILKILPIIGCCSEHDEDFEWYRDHAWKDLRKEITENAEISARGWIQFSLAASIQSRFIIFSPVFLP